MALIQRRYRDNDLVVNYQDACIYGRDLKLLECPTAWLNDSCVHFFLQRLHSGNRESSEDALCIDPSVLSFLMHQCEDEEDLSDFCRGYDNFAGVRRAFLPINDNLGEPVQWQVPGGGSHWSLLVAVEREDGGSGRGLRFYHFDSVPGHNSSAARDVAAAWQVAWSAAKPSTFDPSRPVPFRECRAPRQANGYDCGLHVLGTVEALLLASTGRSHLEDLQECVEQYFGGDPATVCARLRRRIAQDARSLAQRVTDP